MDSALAAALISAIATLVSVVLAAALTWKATQQQHREARRVEVRAQRETREAELRARRRAAIDAFVDRVAGAKEAVRALIDAREFGGETNEFDTAKWLLGELGAEATKVGIHLPAEARPRATTVVHELREALNSIRTENVAAAREAFQRTEDAEAQLNEALSNLES